MKYVICDYWQHADLRLFSTRAMDLSTALAEISNRQLRWAGTDNPPSHLQVYELKASYPVNPPPAEAGTPSQSAKTFPNL
jgi:hypothetical protein